MDTREKRKRNIHLENIQNSCRHILRMVNDLLDVYRIGKGTAFHITLPLPETDETVQSVKMPSTPSAFLPKKVIAIDDDRMQLAIIKEMLERNGIACRACNHVREVTAALREDDYDLVLTDIQMAGTDGFALLSLLRNSNIGNSKEIPVAAMTARGDDRMEEYLKAGFRGCILKPFSMKELLVFLASLMPKGEGHAGIDFSGLIEHVDNKEEVLRLFISETARDIGELEEAQEHGDRAAMRETVHRMLPTWTLLQCENPLYAYQNILRDERTDVETLKGETLRIISQMKGFITEAGQEMTRLEHEEENTDC